MQKNIAIQFNDASKTFYSGKTTVNALSGVTLSISQGDIFGVIGYSGAGKSTLLRMVNSLEKPSAGSVIVGGKNVSELKGAELRDFRKSVGMIFQHFNLLENKTVFENIALPLRLVKTPKNIVKMRVEELLHFVELSEKANLYPSELSGGQKQRVGIARALATNPKILLCDEATSALDPKTTEAILELLKKVNRELGVTILMITHQMNIIQSVCKNVAVLENGKVVESGGVIDVFGEPKEEITKDFVRTVINDRLPDSVKEYLGSYKEPQKVLRLRFEGKNADDPVMSRAIRATGADISILCGIVTELEERLIGFQTVQITGSEKQIENAVDYLVSSGIKFTEVDF